MKLTCDAVRVVLGLFALLAAARCQVPLFAEDAPSNVAVCLSSGCIYSTVTRADGGGRDIIAISPDLGEWTTVVERASRFRVSPDRTSLAYLKRDSGVWSLLVKRLDSAQPIVVLPAVGGPVWPAWSPDSKQLVAKVFSVSSKQSTMYWLHTDGSARSMHLPNSLVCDWSPDGKWFLVVANRFGEELAPSVPRSDIWLVRPDGTDWRQLTRSRDNGRARFSPDGEQVIFNRQDGKTSELWVMNTDGTNAHVVRQGEPDFSPFCGCWSPDGKRIVVQMVRGRRAGRPGAAYLETINADGANPNRLNLEGLEGRYFGSPDWR